MTQLNVGLVQHACSDDLQANLEASINGIRAAAEQGAQLVVLQELHRGLYFCQQEDVDQFDLAEPIPGPTTQRLGELAKSLGVGLLAVRATRPRSLSQHRRGH